jgi:hypothetical protein
VLIGLRLWLGGAPGSGTLTPLWRMHLANRANAWRTRPCGPELPGAFPALGAEPRCVGVLAGEVVAGGLPAVAPDRGAEAPDEPPPEEPPQAASATLATGRHTSAAESPGFIA